MQVQDANIQAITVIVSLNIAIMIDKRRVKYTFSIVDCSLKDEALVRRNKIASSS